MPLSHCVSMNLLCYALAGMRENHHPGLDFEKESVDDDVHDIGGQRLKNCVRLLDHLICQHFISVAEPDKLRVPSSCVLFSQSPVIMGRSSMNDMVTMIVGRQ